MHLLLWPIFRQSHPNFITVRIRNLGTTDKNLLTKSGTEKGEHFVLAVYTHEPRACTPYCLMT